MDRGRGEHAAVAAAAADDDVGTLLEQPDERMDAGHRDHARRGIELARDEVGVSLETLDRFAALHARANEVAIRPRNRNSRP